MAQPPSKSATPVLRAGLTEVLVTGMLIRWISVRPRPMANESLVRSRNIPAVALSNRLGNGGLYQMLKCGGV